MKPKVGVIGVGAMGMGITRALIARGFEVTVRDIVAEREAEAVQAGASAAASARRDGSQGRCADDGRRRCGPDPRRPLRIGAGSRPVVMMCSTIAPSDTEEISRRLGDTPMLDAPISGGPARAHAGTLSVMAAAAARRSIAAHRSRGDGGESVPRERETGRRLAHEGGQQHACGCQPRRRVRGDGDGPKLGLDLRQVADVVGASSGQSWIFDDRMPRALDGDYAPRAAARVLLKDVGLFVHAARQLGLTAPMAECAREIFHDAVARGLGEEDDAAVLKRYTQAWGVELAVGFPDNTIGGVHEPVQVRRHCGDRRERVLAIPAHAQSCASRGDLDARYCDENGDLIADTPKDPKQLQNPATLVFSYTPVEDPAVYENVFGEFMAHLAKITGKKVRWFPAESYAAQVEAHALGRLHIAGVATGPTPYAVNLAGFEPLIAMQRKDGSIGYTLQLITHKDSPIKSWRTSRGSASPTSRPRPIRATSRRAPSSSTMGVVPGKDYESSTRASTTTP
jgi:3-hydroxyisobutyrate dehydrogenase-like beta-hydroxyacid dehydrogenase